MAEARDAELNRYWNALVSGDGAEGFALDADDMDTVRRLHHAAAAMAPGRRADEAWPVVLARMLAAERGPAQGADWQPRPPAPLPFVPNGHAHGTVAPRTGSRPWRIAWGPRPEMLATAALLLLTLATGLVAVGPPRAPAPGAVPLPAVEDAGVAVGQFEPLWQARGGPERLDEPSDLAIDPQGRIWVIDASRGIFEIFAPDGAHLESWGSPGAGEREFDFSSNLTPHGYGDIAFAPDGSFYVVDTGNVRVQKFAPDRSFLLSWGEEGEADGQFLRPARIAVDAAGTVYVSDEQRAIVQVFDGEGRFLNAFGGLGIEEGQLILPQGIAVDPRGMLWVVDRGNNRVQQFAPDGTVRAIVGGIGFAEGDLNMPNDVAVDGLGRVYVAEEGLSRVQVFDRDGRVLASVHGYADNTLFSPLGVAVAANGAVYVSDTSGLRAFRVLLPTSALLMP